MKRKDMWLKLLVLVLALVAASLLGWVALELVEMEKNGGYRMA